jgi:hypothetical protein
MIHGVRLAITSTARSERRIAIRRSGVGIDASSASADPARAAANPAKLVDRVFFWTCLCFDSRRGRQSSRR